MAQQSPNTKLKKSFDSSSQLNLMKAESPNKRDLDKTARLNTSSQKALGKDEAPAPKIVNYSDIKKKPLLKQSYVSSKITDVLEALQHGEIDERALRLGKP
jgi:hypothetical protein